MNKNHTLDQGVMKLPSHQESEQSNIESYIDPESIEALKDRVERLKRSSSHLRMRKKKLTQFSHKMNHQVRSQSKELDELRDVSLDLKNRNLHIVSKLQSDNNALNTSYKRLSTALIDLSNLYRDSEKSGFLSRCNLHDFLEADAKFTQQLTNFTKTQFFDGISNIARSNDDFDPMLSLDASHLASGDSLSLEDSNIKEFARLQAAYPLSELENVKCKVNMRSKESAVHTSELVLSSLQSGTFDSSLSALSSKVEYLESLLLSSRKERQELSPIIESVISQNSYSFVEHVLAEDYEFKLRRQNYFLRNQDEVIKHLTRQRSRNELLSVMCDIEANDHRRLQQILNTEQSDLAQIKSSHDSRMEAMDSFISAIKQRCGRNTIEYRDLSSQRLAKVLGHESPVFFTSYSGLVDHLKSISCETLSGLISTKLDIESCDELEKSIVKLDANFDLNSTMDVKLSSPVVGEHVMQLERILDELEKTVKNVVTDFDKKTKLIARDTFLKTERSLWTIFFTKPQEVEKIFNK